MKELIPQLRQAAKAYYQESREIMSNFEYDKLYDELSALEAKTGIILSGSPTQQVGYQVLSELPKETHEEPMLSLDKTKSVEDLQQWLGNQKGLLSWKMDGLTVVLTYENGTLVKAVTRGNGEIGEVITPNARAFSNIPLAITYKGQLIIRGEAVITYTDFERINDEIGDADAKYKNPRNLCSGSVRQLNSKITAERSVHFEAFALVKAEGVDFKNSRKEQFLWLKNQGFEVVHHEEVTAADLPDKVAWFAGQIGHNDIPSDGLVLLYDDIAYGDSLGRTAKFPRNAIAFKWQDEIRETTLSYIEWSPSRTGLINPVAVFEPVELEGTTVSRASVHNISIMEGLELGAGDKITVYKANMIIPQIADNLTRSGVRDIPKICPVCGGATQIRQTNDVKSLYCTNPECQAKKIKSFTLFVSRDALNIDGLSEATLEKFIGAGFIHEFADIFRLKEHFGEISQMEGFGEKSVANMEQSIEKSRQVHPVNFIFALCIPLIGVDAGKKIVAAIGFEGFLQRLHQGDGFEDIEGIGAERSRSIVTWYQNEKNHSGFEDLLHELSIEHVEVQDTSSGSCAGLSFVITGDVHHYKNRDEFKAYVESQGGKVTGSVSKKTAYLVNNDVESASSKNRKAKELGIPIIMSYGYAPAESENELDPDEIEYHKSLGNMCDVYLELKYADMITEDYEELTEDDIQEMVENGEMLLINVQLHKNRRTMKASCQIQATPKFNYYEE